MTEPPTRRSLYLDEWRIDITRRAGVARIGPDVALARNVVAAARAARAPAASSVGLILTDDAEIAALNESQMGHEGPTDVLSFPLLAPGDFPGHAGQDPAVRSPGGPGFALPPDRRIHLGDIVISVDRAREQAEQGRGGQTGDVEWSVADEMRLLVTHGTLHLCGWDHALPEEEAAMRAVERDLLGA
ncbi:MAG: rRNA maturation RNase YbeY [Candidatus Limnocylindrales bacterium]